MGCLPQLSALVSGSEFSTICVLRHSGIHPSYTPSSDYPTSYSKCCYIWWFPNMGVPPVLIHESMLFSDVPLETLQRAWRSPIHGSLHIWIRRIPSIKVVSTLVNTSETMEFGGSTSKWIWLAMWHFFQRKTLPKKHHRWVISPNL